MKQEKARLTTDPCGELGIWIYVDGELMDLIHYSDLKHSLAFGHPILKQQTIDAIDKIYADIVLERIVEEE